MIKCKCTKHSTVHTLPIINMPFRIQVYSILVRLITVLFGIFSFIYYFLCNSDNYAEGSYFEGGRKRVTSDSVLPATLTRSR